MGAPMEPERSSGRTPPGFPAFSSSSTTGTWDSGGHIGEADIIIGYTRDMWKTRTWLRALMSKTFTLFVNVITHRRVRYYNGLQIHRAAVLKSLRIQSSGYGFQAEVLVKSLRLTRTYVEVPMDLIERKHGESKAF